MGKVAIRVSISPRGPLGIKNPAPKLLVNAKSKNGSAVKDNKKSRQQCSQLQALVDAVNDQRSAAKSASAKIEVEKDKLIALIQESVEKDLVLRTAVTEAEEEFKKELETFVFEAEEKKSSAAKKNSIQALKAQLAKLEKEENSDLEKNSDSSDASDSE